MWCGRVKNNERNKHVITSPPSSCFSLSHVFVPFILQHLIFKDSQRLLKLCLSIFGDPVLCLEFEIGSKCICQSLNLWEGKCASVQRGRESQRTNWRNISKELVKIFPKIENCRNLTNDFLFCASGFWGALEIFTCFNFKIWSFMEQFSAIAASWNCLQLWEEYII